MAFGYKGIAGAGGLGAASSISPECRAQIDQYLASNDPSASFIDWHKVTVNLPPSVSDPMGGNTANGLVIPLGTEIKDPFISLSRQIMIAYSQIEIARSYAASSRQEMTSIMERYRSAETDLLKHQADIQSAEKHIESLKDQIRQLLSQPDPTPDTFDDYTIGRVA